MSIAKTASVERQPFVHQEGVAEWFDVDPLVVYHCRFNMDRYDDSLFGVYGTAFPSSLDSAITKRKAEFLAGRYCARRSLERLGRYNARVGIGPHRSPVWPPSVVGSISHCDGLAVAVAGPATGALGVGIDVENIVTSKTLENIQRQIANGDELSIVEKQPDKQLTNLLFTLLFSAKESFFKAAYPTVGEYFGFDVVSVLAIDSCRSTLWLQTKQPLHPHIPNGMLVEVRYHLLPNGKVATLLVLPRKPGVDGA